jgi:hypothetical protein
VPAAKKEIGAVHRPGAQINNEQTTNWNNISLHFFEADIRDCPLYFGLCRQVLMTKPITKVPTIPRANTRNMGKVLLIKRTQDRVIMIHMRLIEYIFSLSVMHLLRW